MDYAEAGENVVILVRGVPGIKKLREICGGRAWNCKPW